MASSPSMLRRVAVPPVGREVVLVLGSACRSSRSRSSTQVHLRHGEAAAVRDPLDVDDHDRALALLPVLGEGPAQLGELRVGAQHGAAATVQPDDVGRPVERAEHQHDPPVLTQVGDRLGARPGVVQVGDLERAEHGERPGHALGRDVHPAVGAERCGADEEDRLGQQEPGQTWVDRLENLAHGTSLAHRSVGVSRYFTWQDGLGRETLGEAARPGHTRRQAGPARGGTSR